MSLKPTKYNIDDNTGKQTQKHLIKAAGIVGC
jgi:hypothetical protein